VTQDETVTLSASEIIAQTGAETVEWEPRHRFMSPEGVDDPFPDRLHRARPRDGAILLGLGAGLAVSSAITARMTLLPDCEDERDVTTCTVPDGADIGLRSGRLFGTLGFSIGSAAFGAFGARELGQWLQQTTRMPLERRRRIAVGLGSGAVALGVTGIAIGSSVLAVGTKRSLRLASTFDSTTTGTDPEELARLNETVGQIKFARAGLMVLVASPVFLATGISLLVHRPRERRLSVMPNASLTQVGLHATLRF